MNVEIIKSNDSNDPPLAVTKSMNDTNDLAICGRKIINTASLKGKLQFARSMLDAADKVANKMNLEFGESIDTEKINACCETISAAVTEVEKTLDLMKLNIKKISSPE